MVAMFYELDLTKLGFCLIQGTMISLNSNPTAMSRPGLRA